MLRRTVPAVSENLMPTKIRDNRTVAYDLAPLLVVPPQELVDRANQLRQDTQQYPVAPAGAVVPAPPLPGPNWGLSPATQ